MTRKKKKEKKMGPYWKRAVETHCAWAQNTHTTKDRDFGLGINLSSIHVSVARGDVGGRFMVAGGKYAFSILAYVTGACSAQVRLHMLMFYALK